MKPSLLEYLNPIRLADANKKKMLGSKGGKSLPPLENKPQSTQIEEIINSILPPTEYTTKDGTKMIQFVSSYPATRKNVSELQRELDKRLEKRNAREIGICPVRNELFAQAFDELIRQVTVNCPERGLLLLRVRDEIKMSISAYQTLFESSVNFGGRKASESEEGIQEMESSITQFEQEKKNLEKRVKALQARAEAIEKREKERRLIAEKQHEEELSFFRRKHNQLKAELERKK